MNKLKACLPDALAVLFFVAVSFVYFFHPITEGLVLQGHDTTGGIGAGVEMQEYRERTGERTRWTNTLFCGMPTYQMAPSYPSNEMFSKVQDVYSLGLPNYIMYAFILLLGFYILLRAFDFRVWMAMLGAVLWAFSSYYFILIAAGHIWKLLTLAYIPPTVAGLVLCYRGRYLWGVLVTAVFVSLQILSNHVQMSYYFLPVLALMSLAYLIQAVRNHTLPSWWRATISFAIGGLLALCINISSLYHTYQYSKESMRSKSELTHLSNKDPKNQTSSGLERDYITAWSYGLGETWTLLVPNVKGGASQPLTHNATAMSKANAQYMPIYQSLGQYWGEQPGTSGPVYVGAFVMMLFVLGLFIVRGPLKWCLLAATILSILLSWGKNFMPFTDFFLDYVPLYDKFRTVASILVIAEFTIPFLAMLALKEVVENPHLFSKRGTVPVGDAAARPSMGMWPLYTSFLLTGGVAFLFAVMPDVFFGQYISSQELYMFQQATQAGYIPSDMLGGILTNLEDMRRAMFVSDAWRSTLIILAGALLLLIFMIRKITATWLTIGLLILCLGDMWSVNKRYLYDSLFVKPATREQIFAKSAADEQILADTSLYYRVLNLSSNTFNENETSYYHKSLGGYHAAKLRRYQELIERYISPEMMRLQHALSENELRLDSVPGDTLFPVLNMLNAKYFIVGLQGGNTLAVRNPYCQGNAWFVNRVHYVSDADAEIAGLQQYNLKTDAVADARFREVLGEAGLNTDSTASVTLTQYDANALTYHVESQQGGVVVFSEIFYPGWQATLDGKPIEIGRVNYVLRALRVPAGKHVVTFRFDPQSLHITEAIAFTALALLVLVFLFLLFRQWKKQKD